MAMVGGADGCPSFEPSFVRIARKQTRQHGLSFDLNVSAG
jgi:hypothetical protein